MPDSHSALVMQNMEANQGRSIGEPTPPVTTGGDQMLMRDKSSGPRARSCEEPGRIMAGYCEAGLSAFWGDGGGAGGAGEAMRNFTAAGADHGMLAYNGVPGFVRELGDAIGTITSRDKQALLIPYFRTGVARPLGQPAAARLLRTIARRS